MVSGYPNPNGWQPRWLAFAASWGRTDAGFKGIMRNVDFFAFIDRCKQSAPAGVFINGSLADNEAFTAHCWNVARDDLYRRFPA